MPSAPSASPGRTRARSRTSDFSDFLRGRHDTKVTSMDSPSRPPPSQIPPVPRLSPSAPEPAPVTPPKPKSKFGFLGRKRKQSFSPSSLLADASAASAAVASVAAHGNANAAGTRREPDGKQAPPVSAERDGGNQPIGVGPSIRPAQASGQQRAPPSGIPVPQSPSPSPRSNGVPTPNTHFSPYGPTPTLAHNLRKQKASFESTRRSTESRSSARPIITVSPPHNNIHDGDHAYTAPRSAPLPSGQQSPQRPQTSLPTPAASDPESPTSADIPSPRNSTHSTAQSVVPLSQFPDDQLQSTTSFKEETLLRKNHFDIDDAQPRRGTVSLTNNQPAPATVGFPPSRTERRHVSVMQLSRLKKEIIATAPKIRKMPSDSSSIGSQRDLSLNLGRSHTISTSPPRTPHSDEQAQAQGSSPLLQQSAGKRVPPPLKRTWHTPPMTGPPKEPLPSPPASAARATPTPTTSDSFRTAPPSPATPLSPRRTLPPLVPPKEITLPSIARAQGPMSPDSLTSINLSVPPSPARSLSDGETDRDPPSSQPSPRTPVREDPARRVLADENATSRQLRDALQHQVDKYKRLSSYLLSLTERHALERAELMTKIESLEQEKERRERELKGLKWLVAHSGARDAPARSDSGVMPGTRLAKCKAPPRDVSWGAVASRSIAMSVGTLGADGRVSIDSPAESVEEGLVELQTTISEFIVPEPEGAQVLQPPSVSAEPSSAKDAGSGAGARRRMRSNTMPNRIWGTSAPSSAQAPSTAASKIAQSTKVTRRTSSPVLPCSGSPSTLAKRQSVSIPASCGAGLGFGTGLDGASSPKSFSRSPSPDNRVDLHARSDSSTLSSLPSLSTIHSSASSALSSIPETPRTDVGAPANQKDKEERVFDTSAKRLSTSSTSSSGSGISGGSSRVSVSPSIAQVLDKTKTKIPSGPSLRRQPEMEAILRRLRVFGQDRSP